MVKKIVVPPGFHENVNFELIDPRETAAGGGGGDSGNNNDAVSNCGDSDCGSDINGLVGNGGNSAAVRGGGKVKSDPFIAPTRILYCKLLLVICDCVYNCFSFSWSCESINLLQFYPLLKLSALNSTIYSKYILSFPILSFSAVPVGAWLLFPSFLCGRLRRGPPAQAEDGKKCEIVLSELPAHHPFLPDCRRQRKK